jgi:hypothetical protein
MIVPTHANANPKITAAIAGNIPDVYNLALSLARPGAALEPWPVGALSDPAWLLDWPSAEQPPEGQGLAVELLAAGVDVGTVTTV